MRKRLQNYVRGYLSDKCLSKQKQANGTIVACYDLKPEVQFLDFDDETNLGFIKRQAVAVGHPKLDLPQAHTAVLRVRVEHFYCPGLQQGVCAACGELG